MDFRRARISAIQKNGDGQHDRDYGQDDQHRKCDTLAVKPGGVVAVAGRVEHADADNFAGRTARTPGG